MEELPRKKQKRVKYMAYGARQDDDYKHIDYEYFRTPVRDTEEEVYQDLIDMYKEELFEDIEEDGSYYSDRNKYIAIKNNIPDDFILVEDGEPKLSSKYGVEEKLSWMYKLTSVGEYTNPKWKYEIITIEI